MHVLSSWFITLLLLASQPASAMSGDTAIYNLTFVAWAFQEAEFCEQQGFASQAQLSRWMKQNEATYRASLAALESYTQQLNDEESAVAKFHIIGHIRKKVAQQARFSGKDCTRYANALKFYRSQFKP